MRQLETAARLASVKPPGDDGPTFHEYLELRKSESENGSPESVYEAAEIDQEKENESKSKRNTA
jgi:hypothetical protein